MKKKPHAIAWIWMISIVISMLASTIGASADNQSVPLYEPEMQAIFDKIEGLASAKAAVNQYRHRYGVSEGDVNPEYEKIKAQADAIRQDLIEMGARSIVIREELSAFALEDPVKIAGVSIDNLADFADTSKWEGKFDAWDIWSVSQTTPDGTAVICDFMLQDAIESDILSTYVTQDGRAGWEFYGSASPTGNTKSYLVYCDIVPTIHFIFVRDSNAASPSAWKHCLTTNTAAVRETHSQYSVTAQNGKPVPTADGEKVYENTLRPEEYDCRLANATQIFRENQSLVTDVLREHTIKIQAEEHDADVEAVPLAIRGPEKESNHAVWIILTIGTVLLIGIAVRKIHQKKKIT